MRWGTHILLILLLPHWGRCQVDSSRTDFKHAISFELGGNALVGININYHHFWQMRSKLTVYYCARVGFGTPSMLIIKDRVVDLPIDFTILIGKRVVKYEVGLGYVALMGKQTFSVFDHWSYSPTVAITRTETVYFFDLIVPRLGIAVIPTAKGKQFPYIRLSWTPLYIPWYETAPYNSNDYSPEQPKRFYPLWGGVTVGIAF